MSRRVPNPGDRRDRAQIVTPERAAGGLLLGGLLIGLLALGIMIASGALPGFTASRQGSLEGMAPYADTFRVLNLLWAQSWIVLLAGVSLLTRLLVRAGHSQVPIVALALAVVATFGGVLHGTFHMSVETWAAEEAARGGAVAAIYEPLDAWVGGIFRIGYALSLASMVGFGWSLLAVRLLAPWVGSLTLGWSALWMVAGIVGVGVPALPLIMPAVIGLALLVADPRVPATHSEGGIHP